LYFSLFLFPLSLEGLPSLASLLLFPSPLRGEEIIGEYPYLKREDLRIDTLL